MVDGPGSNLQRATVISRAAGLFAEAKGLDELLGRMDDVFHLAVVDENG